MIPRVVYNKSLDCLVRVNDKGELPSKNKLKTKLLIGSEYDRKRVYTEPDVETVKNFVNKEMQMRTLLNPLLVIRQRMQRGLVFQRIWRGVCHISLLQNRTHSDWGR